MTAHISGLVQSTLMKNGGIKQTSPLTVTVNLKKRDEDTKGTIRIRKSKKDKQHNDQVVAVSFVIFIVYMYELGCKDILYQRL